MPIEALEKQTDKQDPYHPTDAQQEVLDLMQSRFYDALEVRRRSYRLLNDRSPEAFWEDSQDAYDTYVPPKSDIEEDWTSDYYKPKTRNKTNAIIANIFASNIGIDLSAYDIEEKLDKEFATTSSHIYDWTLERENFDMNLFKVIHQACVEGTGILYEEIAWDSRQVREIDDMDYSLNEITFTDKKERIDFKGCRSSVVPNKEFYPGNVWVFDIQEQPYIFRRKLTTFEAADSEMSKWPDWKFVVPGSKNFFGGSEQDDNPEFEDDDSDENKVEILYYWSWIDDAYHIAANGVLLTKPVSPIPYPHKKYPFAKMIFQHFSDHRFFYGNSVPNLNIDDQNLTNDLWRFIVDSFKLKNKPPLFTTNADLLNTDIAQPGIMAPIKAGDEVRTIPELTKGVSGDEFNVLQLAERSIDESTISPISAGQIAEKDVLATEVNALTGSAQRIKGAFEAMLGYLLVEHAHIRVPNMLWFLTQDDEYKMIVQDDIKTTRGKGKRKIVFVNESELPASSEDLLTQVVDIEEKTQEIIEAIFVNKDSVNDYRFHASISPIPKPRRSSANRILRAIQKYNIYAPNPLIDQSANTRNLVEAFGDNPDEMVAQPQQQPDPGIGGTLGGGKPQQPQEGAQGVPASVQAAMTKGIAQQGGIEL